MSISHGMVREKTVVVVELWVRLRSCWMAAEADQRLSPSLCKIRWKRGRTEKNRSFISVSDDDNSQLKFYTLFAISRVRRWPAAATAVVVALISDLAWMQLSSVDFLIIPRVLSQNNHFVRSFVRSSSHQRSRYLDDFKLLRKAFEGHCAWTRKKRN